MGIFNKLFGRKSAATTRPIQTTQKQETPRSAAPNTAAKTIRKCSKCNTTSTPVSDIEGVLYCKKCSPITAELISLLDTKATSEGDPGVQHAVIAAGGAVVPRSALPKDLASYFASSNVGFTGYVPAKKFVCRNCNQLAPHYEWYDNNYPSTQYWFCAACYTIFSQVD